MLLLDKQLLLGSDRHLLHQILALDLAQRGSFLFSFDYVSCHSVFHFIVSHFVQLLIGRVRLFVFEHVHISQEMVFMLGHGLNFRVLNELLTQQNYVFLLFLNRLLIFGNFDSDLVH